MQSEASAHEAPEDAATPEVAETPTLPASEASGDVETTTVEVAATAEESNLTPFQQYQAALAQLDAQPAEPEAAEPVADEVRQGEPVETELVPEADSQAEPTEETEEAPEAVETEEPEDASEKKPKQYRLRPRSEVADRAFQLLKEDEYLSEEDAFAQAKQELNPDPEPETADEPVGNQPEIPEGYENLTSEEMFDRINTLKDEAVDQLENDADFEAFAQTQRKINALEKAHRQLTTQEAIYERQFEESKQAVVNKYPVAKDPNSAFTARVADLYDIWIEQGDPRADRADAPVLIADLVARELNVSPHSAENPSQKATERATGATPPKPQSQVPPRKTQAAPSIAPASGAHRTTNHQLTVEAALRQIKTPADYEAVKEQMLAARG